MEFDTEGKVHPRALFRWRFLNNSLATRKEKLMQPI